jgi:hypothetical protein
MMGKKLELTGMDADEHGLLKKSFLLLMAFLSMRPADHRPKAFPAVPFRIYQAWTALRNQVRKKINP